MLKRNSGQIAEWLVFFSLALVCWVLVLVYPVVVRTYANVRVVRIYEMARTQIHTYVQAELLLLFAGK